MDVAGRTSLERAGGPSRTDVERSWAALGRELFESAALAPDWAPAFADVPRCAFLPELMWPYDPDAGDNVAVAKSADPWAWQAYAHADVPIVTQWDDGRHTGTSPGRVASSSASMPSVVASMLARLDVRPGLRILEIGTGTGWNAGLLAHRLGDAAVTSVEVDPAVAATARAALARAGLNPTVITGDGSLGHPRARPMTGSSPPAACARSRPPGSSRSPPAASSSRPGARTTPTVTPSSASRSTGRRPAAASGGWWSS